MAEPGGQSTRVLLLARAGDARQKLEQALAEAGAELLRSADPAEADPAALAGLRPDAVLVALEPAIEDALERHDALLTDPGVLVMFDEAELAARRDGWDAARWVRHLAAKLHGHQNVLPEGAEADDGGDLPEPGALPGPRAEPGSAELAVMGEEAHALAADVPQAGAFAPASPEDASLGASAGLGANAMSPGDAAAEQDGQAGEASPAAAVPDAIDVGTDGNADADATTNADADADAGVGAEADAGSESGAGDAAGIEVPGATGGGFAGLVAAEDMDWSSGPGDGVDALADDPELAALLASSEAARSADRDAAPPVPGLEDALSAHALDDDASETTDAAPPPSDDRPGADAPVDPSTLGNSLSLAEDDAPLATRSEDAAIDLAALELRLAGLSLADDDGPLATETGRGEEIDLDALGSGLSLADDEGPIVADANRPPSPDPDAFDSGLSLADPDSYGHGVLRGAVFVEAGLGGPDAVRQLLGRLGEAFARPVLVRLQLDGGRYERLVQQMQRASVLPVALAEAGNEAEGGKVYFLPPDIAVVEDRSRLRFAAGDHGYNALPAHDSALVFLSGASSGRVDAAMALAAEGALVLAQTPDSCYDPAAVNALIARGAVAAEPGDLAQALADRWP